MEIIRATEGNLVPSRSKLVYSRYTKKGCWGGGSWEKARFYICACGQAISLSKGWLLVREFWRGGMSFNVSRYKLRVSCWSFLIFYKATASNIFTSVQEIVVWGTSRFRSSVQKWDDSTFCQHSLEVIRAVFLPDIFSEILRSLKFIASSTSQRSVSRLDVIS